MGEPTTGLANPGSVSKKISPIVGERVCRQKLKPFLVSLDSVG